MFVCFKPRLLLPLIRKRMVTTTRAKKEFGRKWPQQRKQQQKQQQQKHQRHQQRQQKQQQSQFSDQIVAN